VTVFVVVVIVVVIIVGVVVDYRHRRYYSSFVPIGMCESIGHSNVIDKY